jgi:hypothetical protein
MEFLGDTVFYDPTNPQARKHVWKIVKQNYYDKGIRIFWLDEAEPEYAVYDFDHYRYHLGPNLEVGNLYPPPRGRRISSIFFGALGQEANDTAHSSGRAISTQASNRCATSSLPDLIWDLPEFPGGPQILADFTAAWTTIRPFENA